jgi:aerobic-type carbon monoxide dehydrogenase small subunit (CoxS/CutS family)
MTDMRTISLTLNGAVHTASTDVRVNLADFLRHQLAATGTHVGCEHGVCGACTVIVDDQPVRACLMLAVQADGARVETVEGLGQDGIVSDLQAAFSRHHGLQCGFCTPGMLMTLQAFLKETPDPDEAAVREAISGNICRCTGYQGIVAAALDVAAMRRGA